MLCTRIKFEKTLNGVPVRFNPSPVMRRRLLEAMRLDKKVRGGQIQFVLAHRIGSVEHGCHVPQALLKRAVANLNT